MLKLDEKLTSLPFSKSSPEILKSIFGEKELSPRWIADLDFSLAEPLQKILIDRIKNSGFGYEYKDNSFLKAQEDWYQRRYEIDLKKHQRFFSPTIMTSLAIIIENFTNPEDGVIIQTPVYPEFKKVIGLQGREAVKNPLVLKQNGYEIDFDDLREKANEAKNKILLLCSPHNPVGRSWHFDELEKVVNICRENNLLLISDEIHRDIMLFKNRFISICSFSEHFQNFFMLASEAKTFNLCSICDSLIVTPNEKIGEKVKRTLNKYQLGRTNGLTRAVLQGIYEMDDAWTHALIEVVEKKRFHYSTRVERNKIQNKTR